MIDLYPTALWIPADPSNYRKAGRTYFKNVVIHVTDGHPAPYPVAEMWQQPGHGSSAHFVIGQNGCVMQAVHLSDVAYHAHAANATSVGIEHCVRTPGELGPDDVGLPPSKELYQASAKLVAWLCKTEGLTPDRDVIQGHAEIDPATTHDDCPNGPSWNWRKYVANPDAWPGWDWINYMIMVDDEYAKLGVT